MTFGRWQSLAQLLKADLQVRQTLAVMSGHPTPVDRIRAVHGDELVHGELDGLILGRADPRLMWCGRSLPSDISRGRITATLDIG